MKTLEEMFSDWHAKKVKDFTPIFAAGKDVPPELRTSLNYCVMLSQLFTPDYIKQMQDTDSAIRKQCPDPVQTRLSREYGFWFCAAKITDTTIRVVAVNGVELCFELQGREWILKERLQV